MVEVVITGIGLLSALGSLKETWGRLLLGDVGIRLHQPFPELPPMPLALIGSEPYAVLSIVKEVVEAALLSANLSPDLPHCGVVIGSSRSQQAVWEKLARLQFQECRQNNFPLTIEVDRATLWLETLPYEAALQAARMIGSHGPVLAPMAACATGLVAIAQGFELIQSGQCQQVLVGAVESPITPLTLAGFRQMGALARTGAYPFDQAREGFVLGEGGAALILESEAMARERNAWVYGRVRGFGWTTDGYHVSTPDPSSRGAITAVKHCLERSQLSSMDVHYIHAHGTATDLNDRQEAQLVQKVFSVDTPISSTKGATGHTLGASGAIGTALCLMALQEQILPPCVGLRGPAFDLNLVRRAQPASIETVLCCSFGFGGQNTVIALSR